MDRSQELLEERGQDTERLVFFSDAVFAIALTLLVIDVRLPEQLAAQDLASALAALGDTLIALVISFFTISAFWRSHHRIFRAVISYNSLLITLNSVLLLGVVLVPFTTSLASRYGTQELAMLIFIANIGLTSLVFTALWLYVSKQGLIDPELSPQMIRGFTLRSVLLTLTFFSAAPFTLIVKPSYAPLIWLATGPIVHVIMRAYSARTPAASTSTLNPTMPPQPMQSPPASERSHTKRR